MKELPLELWSIIAKLVKRQQPPAGAEANWNDHLNQQDLVSLQLVSKVHHLSYRPTLHTRCSLLIYQDMYKTVSPILYHTPIVQNLGLFLLGIEQPPRAADDDDVIPYHKSKLLNKVTKLHLIHSSSRKAVGTRYMTMPSSHEATPRVFNENDLRICNADRLGLADLEGWLLATRILRATPSARTMFNRLETLSFGTWDDGRWQYYGGRQSPSSHQDNNVDPLEYLERMLADFIRRVRTASSIQVCSNTQSQIDLRLDRGPCTRTITSGLRVTHGSRSDTLYTTDIGPTRIYVRPTPRRTLDSNFHDAALARWLYQNMYYIGSLNDREATPDTILELCLTTSLDEEIYSTSSCENELELARRTKEALELYCQDLVDREEWAKRALGKIRIYVGDEIPACPCCGGKE